MTLHRMLRFGALAAALLAGSLPAHADMQLKDGTGALQSVCTTIFGSPSKHAYCHYLVDINGTAFGTAGNPFHATLNFGGTDLALGQATAAKSLPVVLPSNPDILNAAATITAADAASTTTTGQNGVSVVSGTPTAGSVYSVAVNGQSEADFVIGAFTGTLVFEGSANGGLTWTPRSAHVMGTKYRQTQVTGPGVFHINAAGLTNVRVRAIALASGTPSIQLNTTAGTGSVYVMNDVELVDQGTGLSPSTKAGGSAAPTDPAMTVQNPNEAALQTALNTAIGACTEAAWTGTGTPTLCSVLKAMFSQAAPTSNPGSSIGSSTPVPGFQGVAGGVPFGANILLGGVAPSLASPLPAGLSVAGAAVSASNPMPSDTVVKGAGTDAGGTIATGGTAQQFMAANTNRRGWRLQNQSSGALYVNCIATATADQHSLLIAAGAFYTTDPQFVETSACSIIGATAGQAFFARQF